MTLYYYDKYLFDVDADGSLNRIKIMKTLPRVYDTTFICCSILATSHNDKTYARVIDSLGNIALCLDAYALIHFWTALIDEHRMKHKGRDPKHGAGNKMQTIFRGSHREIFNAGLMIISGTEGRNHEERAIIALTLAQHPEGWRNLRAQFYAAENGLPKPS